MSSEDSVLKAFNSWLFVLPPRLCTLTLLVLPAPPMSLQVLALVSFTLLFFSVAVVKLVPQGSTAFLPFFFVIGGG